MQSRRAVPCAGAPPAADAHPAGSQPSTAPIAAAPIAAAPIAAAPIAASPTAAEPTATADAHTAKGVALPADEQSAGLSAADAHIASSPAVSTKASSLTTPSAITSATSSATAIDLCDSDLSDGENDDKPQLSAQERAKRDAQRKAYRADEHFFNYRQFKQALNVRRVHTSPSNVNCLAFSTFGAAGLLNPSAPDAASKAAGNDARKEIHTELMKRLPRFSQNASDAWHGGLSRSEGERFSRCVVRSPHGMSQPLMVHPWCALCVL